MENKINAPFSNFFAWFWSICNNELSLDLVEYYLLSLNTVVVSVRGRFVFSTYCMDVAMPWAGMENLFRILNLFSKINNFYSWVSRENNFQWFILNSHSESIYSSIDFWNVTFWNVTYYRVKVGWWEPKWISGMDKSLFLINPLFCQLSACLFFFSKLNDLLLSLSAQIRKKTV